MTPEAQRIAIAEACGWTNVEWQTFPGGMQNPVLMGSPPGKNVQRYVPDYLSDLNAMHEAEKVLTPDQLEHYRLTVLPNVCGGITKAVTATAAQRAEAFLLTLNLWHDSK